MAACACGSRLRQRRSFHSEKLAVNVVGPSGLCLVPPFHGYKGACFDREPTEGNRRRTWSMHLHRTLFIPGKIGLIIIIIIRLLRIKAAHNTLQYIKRSSSNERAEIKTNTTMKETNVQN